LVLESVGLAGKDGKSSSQILLSITVLYVSYTREREEASSLKAPNMPPPEPLEKHHKKMP
jgi:hypothetical protein